MPMPLSQDYNEAIQNPQSSFSDPELKQGQAVTNALAYRCPAPATSPTSTPADAAAERGPSSASPAKSPASASATSRSPTPAPAAASLHGRLQVPGPGDQGSRPMVPGAEDALGRRIHAQPVRSRPAPQSAAHPDLVPDLGETGRPAEGSQHGALRPAARQRDAGPEQARLPGRPPGGLRRHVRAGPGVPQDHRGRPSQLSAPASHQARLLRRRGRPLLAPGHLHGAESTADFGKPLWNKFENGDNLLFRQQDLAAPAARRSSPSWASTRIRKCGV